MATFIVRGKTLLEINEEGPPTPAGRKAVEGDRIIYGDKIFQVQGGEAVPVRNYTGGHQIFRGRGAPELCRYL